jgi:hypothetical protein
VPLAAVSPRAAVVGRACTNHGDGSTRRDGGHGGIGGDVREVVR